MKRITYSRIAIISEKDAAAFEASINSRLDELADYKPELIMESVKDHTAYIRYKYDEYVPENIADKFDLMGVKYYCKDCDYCERITNKDGSISKVAKKAYCRHHNKQIYFECIACETFFYELVSHTGQHEAAAALPAESLQMIESKEKAADHHADR